MTIITVAEMNKKPDCHENGVVTLSRQAIQAENMTLLVKTEDPIVSHVCLVMPVLHDLSILSMA